MGLARRIHLLLGAFFAPGILFFAFSGMLQTLEVNERKGDVPPPAWVSHISQVHKNQSWTLRRRPPGPPPGAQAQAPGGAEAPRPPRPPQQEEEHEAFGHELLQAFFAALGIGLMISTCTGIAMAWEMKDDRVLAACLFAAGAIIPIALLAA